MTIRWQTNQKKIIKPLLEILAAVPTVVYGFFALMVVTPFLQKLIPEMAGFNSLSAGIVMGIMMLGRMSGLLLHSWSPGPIATVLDQQIAEKLPMDTSRSQF